MRSRLLWKLLGVNVAAIASVILMVWITVDYLAADYFVTLMREYNISPTSSHQMFLDAVHRYLLWASLAALLVALGLGFLLTRRILGPLSRMAVVTREIARGNYASSVSAPSRDEVGQLADALNQMAASLSRLEGLRKRMVVDVAHELRTPLTNLRGYLEALVDGVLPPSLETLKTLQEEALRLGVLVEDLLRLARADAARLDLRREEVRLDQLIGSLLEAHAGRFAERGIDVEVSGGGPTSTVFADARKLAQILDELLENAFRYTPKGGRVRIRTEISDSLIRVVFTNSGGEISPEDLPFLFERFYRGEKSRSRETGGAGIGLAIVKELIEAHGGSVDAGFCGEDVRIGFTLPRTLRPSR